MKITIVVPNSGARDARIMKQARTLKNEGHHVSIVGSKEKAYPSYRSITKEGIKVYRASIPEKSTKQRELFFGLLSIGSTGLFFGGGLLLFFWLTTVSYPFGARFFQQLISDISADKFLIAVLLGGSIFFMVISIIVLALLGRHLKKSLLIKHLFENFKKLQDSLMSKLSFAIRRHVMKTEFIQLLDELRPDLIYCNECMALEACVAAKKKLAVPLIYDAHEFYDNLEGNNADYLSKIYSSIHRSCFPQVDAFVTVSEAILELYRDAEYQLPSKVIVLPNSIPPAKVSKYDGRLHKAAKLPENQHILLYQGGISLRRKVDEVALAAAEMPDGWSVVIMGSGADAEEIEAIAEGINKKYFFDSVMKLIQSDIYNEYVEIYNKHMDQVCAVNDQSFAINVLPGKQNNLAATSTNVYTNSPNVKPLSTLLDGGFQDFFKLSPGSIKRITTRKIAMQEKLVSHLKTKLKDWSNDLVTFRSETRSKESDLAHKFAFIEITTKHKFEIAKRVVIIPPVPNEDLLNWTQGAKIGIVPYPISCQNHWGAAPNKLWEYPTAGVPLMVTPSQKMFDVIDRYGCGWLLSSDPTAKEIKDQISMLKSGDFERAKLACEKFIGESNWDIHCIPWLSLVESVGDGSEKS